METRVLLFAREERKKKMRVMSFKLTQVRSPNESGLLKRVGRFGFEGLVRLVSMVTRLDDSVQLICPYKRVGSGQMGYTLVQLVNTSTIPRVLCHFHIFRIKEKLFIFHWIITFGLFIF